MALYKKQHWSLGRSFFVISAKCYGIALGRLLY